MDKDEGRRFKSRPRNHEGPAITAIRLDGGTVPEGVSILLFEGSYLLFDEDGWTDLADRWDASLWLDVPEDVLAHRLTQRWLDQGMTQQDAVARAQGNDIPNARRVLKRAKTATRSLRNWQASSE